ncbi:hypothetical protein [Archaeoglobus sp.]
MDTIRIKLLNLVRRWVEDQELLIARKEVNEVANILWKEIERIHREINIQKAEIDRKKVRIEILGLWRAKLLEMYKVLAELLFVWRELKKQLDEVNTELKEIEEEYSRVQKELKEVVEKIKNTDFSKDLNAVDPKLLELGDMILNELLKSKEIKGKGTKHKFNE